MNDKIKGIDGTFLLFFTIAKKLAIAEMLELLYKCLKIGVCTDAD